MAEFGKLIEALEIGETYTAMEGSDEELDKIQTVLASLKEASSATNYPLAEYRKMGLTHFHYGWSNHPWEPWTEEQKQAFQEGYEAARSDDAKADAEGLYDKEHADDEPTRRRIIVRRNI